ncbi:MAG: endolytic transglycosylase MltG, partial [Methylobacterium sp.]|nr:endolytic transglycosylase MltG [Methylobacterium sp.]
MTRLMFRLLLIGLAGAVAFAGWMYHFTGQPLQLPSASHDLVIEHGSSLRSISQQLVDEKLLAEPWSFMLLVRFSGKASALQAGNYRLQHLNFLAAKQTALARMGVHPGHRHPQRRLTQT